MPESRTSYQPRAARRLRQEACREQIKDKLRGDAFRTEGFFYRSVGAVTSETVRYYVQNAQQKHRVGLDFNACKQHKEDGQTALTSF